MENIYFFIMGFGGTGLFLITTYGLYELICYLLSKIKKIFI